MNAATKFEKWFNARYSDRAFLTQDYHPARWSKIRIWTTPKEWRGQECYGPDQIGFWKLMVKTIIGR